MAVVPPSPGLAQGEGTPGVREGTRNAIADFAAYLKSHGVRLVILTFPYESQFPVVDGDAWRQAAESVLSESEKLGVTVCDATPSMVKARQEGHTIYEPPPADFHPKSAGYQAMYEAVDPACWEGAAGGVGIVGDSFADGFSHWVNTHRIGGIDVLHVSSGSDRIPSRLALKSGQAFLEGKKTLVWVLGQRYFSTAFSAKAFPPFLPAPVSGSSSSVSEEFRIEEVSELPKPSDLVYPICHLAVLAVSTEDPDRRCYLYFPVYQGGKLSRSLFLRLARGVRVVVEGEELGSGGPLDSERSSHMIASDFEDYSLPSYWVGEYSWSSHNLEAALEGIRKASTEPPDRSPPSSSPIPK